MANNLDTRPFWKRAIPYIKPNLGMGEPGLMRLSHADSPVFRDLNEDLFIEYLVDQGDHFSYLQNRHLDRDVAVSDVHQTALANLVALTEGGIRIDTHGNVFGLYLDGNFEASLLLLDALWDDSLFPYVTDDFVVAVPSRDVLAFCGLNNPSGIDELQQVVARVFPLGDHNISKHLYRRRGCIWVRHDA